MKNTCIKSVAGGAAVGTVNGHFHENCATGRVSWRPEVNDKLTAREKSKLQSINWRLGSNNLAPNSFRIKFLFWKIFIWKISRKLATARHENQNFFKSQWGPPRTPCVIIERIKTHERPAISKICKWAESKCRKRLTSTGRKWPSGWSNPTQLDTNR